MYTVLLVCRLPKQDLIQEATQDCTYLTHVGDMHFMTEQTKRDVHHVHLANLGSLVQYLASH